MTARPATVEQLLAALGPSHRSPTLTPRGHSAESEKLYAAGRDSIEDYVALPVSRLHFHSWDDQSEILRIAEKDLHSMLAAFRGRLPADFFLRIRQRLPILLSSDDWEDGDELPNPESFRGMLKFLANHSRLRTPSIFLNRQGLFTCAWRPAREKLTSMAFHPDGGVSWMIFVPKADSEGGTDEVAGRSDIESVMRWIESNGGAKWMLRPSFLARIFRFG